jgi:hypothetical protein
MSHGNSPLVTVWDAADALGLGVAQVLDLLDDGQLAGRDISGQTFVLRDSLDAFVDDLTGVRS